MLIPFGLSSTTMFQFQQIRCRKQSRTDREDVTDNRSRLTVWKRQREGVCVVNKDMNSCNWIQVVVKIILDARYCRAKSSMTVYTFVPTNTHTHVQTFPYYGMCLWLGYHREEV